MEKFILENSIEVFCVPAKSFPDGVVKAHQILHSYVTSDNNRRFFGISNPDKTGKIQYKAAEEELIEGELSKHNLERFTIPKGTYVYLTVKNFRKNVFEIGETFRKVFTTPDIDPKGFCLEWYFNDTDCRCMVKLIDNK